MAKTLSDPLIPVFSPWRARSIRECLLDCIETGWFSSLGPYVRRFEEEFAGFCGTRHGIAVSSGTAALHLALAAAGIGRGDEVVVPALTFVATANAVRYTGATPIFADVDRKTWTLDPAELERRITPRTKAVIPVHLYGHPAEMDRLSVIARSKNLLVLEDAAQAHGAMFRGKPVGGLGRIGAFSFYGNKIISTGEGGMLVTNDSELAARAAFLRDQAMDPETRYLHTEIGFNYRMTNLQAAVGCAQMEDIQMILDRKRRVARLYAERLAGIPGLTLQAEAPWAASIHWMVSVLVEERFGQTRDRVTQALRAQRIETRPFFIPMHRLPPHLSEESLPVAEELARKGINLPSGPTLTDNEVERVCSALAELSR